MSAIEVQQITISNEGTSDAVVTILDINQASAGPGYTLLLRPATYNVPFYLNTMEQMSSGAVFMVRVMTVPAGRQALSSTLTYVFNAGTSATFVIGGTSTLPSISFQGIEVLTPSTSEAKSDP